MAPAGAVQKDQAETAESMISLMVDHRTRFFPQAMPRSYARALLPRSAQDTSLLPSGRGNFPLQYNCCAVVVTMQEKRNSPRHQQSSRNSSLADMFFVVQASDPILSFGI